MTVTPAYGRDFKTAKAARKSWNDNQDWIVRDLFSKWDGKPINKSHADLMTISIFLRFNSSRNTCEA